MEGEWLKKVRMEEVDETSFQECSRFSYIRLRDRNGIVFFLFHVKSFILLSEFSRTMVCLCYVSLNFVSSKLITKSII